MSRPRARRSGCVFTDLNTRGGQDILIAVTDGLKGMAKALAASYPRPTLQTCLIHLIRASLAYADWKPRTPRAAALREIDTAPSAEAAPRLGARESALRFPAGGAPRA